MATGCCLKESRSAEQATTGRPSGAEKRFFGGITLRAQLFRMHMSMLNSEINGHENLPSFLNPSQYALVGPLASKCRKEEVDLIAANVNNRGDDDFAVNLGQFSSNVDFGYGG